MVALAIVLALALLLVLNAIVVSNETRGAEVNAPGGELVEGFGGELQVVDEGRPDGPPIVLIHGYACSLRWYDALAARLADRFRVIRIDLLGHGGSEAPAAGYAIEEQARTIASALAELGVEDATAVGHSLGGAIVVALAEQSPELTGRLVVIDSGADSSYGGLSFTARLGYVPVVGQAINRFGRIAPDSIVRGQFEQAFAPGFSFAAGFEDPDQPVEDYRQLTYTAYVETHEARDDYVDQRPLDERLTELGLPLLAIFGAEDQILDPADRALDAYRDVPGMRAVLLPQIGHSPHVEAPDQVAALINEFATEPGDASLKGEQSEFVPQRKQRSQGKKQRTQKKDRKQR